jgi:hypothetical protein
MKKIHLVFIFCLVLSCSKEDINCSSCHLVIYEKSTSFLITDLVEYCSEELVEIQNNGYLVVDSIFTDYLGDSLLNPILPGNTLYYHCGHNHNH